jgi:integrase
VPKLTAKLIERQPKPAHRKQAILRDSELKGFGVRLTPTTISYICEARVNGRPKRLTICRYPDLTPEEARKEARKLLGQMASGKTPGRPRSGIPTLSEVLEKFLATRPLRPSSVRHYRGVLERCLPDWLGMRIDKINKEMVLQRHKELTRPTRQGTDGRAQANKALELLRILLNFAQNNFETPNGEPIIGTNPVTTLNRNRSWHKAKQRQIVIPDHRLPEWYGEVMKLSNETLRDYLLFLLVSGLRRSECAAMRWDTNVDFDNRLIVIDADATKNGKEHRLPMSEFMYALLKKRYDSQPQCAEYVFPGRGGKFHIVDNTHVLKGVAHRSGCQFVLHDLRRTFLSQGERLGLSSMTLRRLANHSGGRDVTAGYIIIDVEQLREPMERISGRFLELMNADQNEWKHAASRTR